MPPTSTTSSIVRSVLLNRTAPLAPTETPAPPAEMLPENVPATPAPVPVPPKRMRAPWPSWMETPSASPSDTETPARPMIVVETGCCWKSLGPEPP